MPKAVADLALEHRRPCLAYSAAPSRPVAPLLTVVARLSSGDEKARRAMQDKARAWTLSLLPTLQQQVGVVVPHGQPIDVFVRVGSAIAGLEVEEGGQERHCLWGDLAAQRFGRTEYLLIFTVAGLACDLPSLAHLVGRLPHGATVTLTPRLKRLTVFSREQLLAHCGDPWQVLDQAGLDDEEVLPALERAFVFRRFASVGHATVGMDLHRHGGFDNGGYRWQVTASVTASSTPTFAQAEAQPVAGQSSAATSAVPPRGTTRPRIGETSSDDDEDTPVEEACHICDRMVTCRGVEDYVRHLSANHRAEMGQLDRWVKDVVSLAIRVLKDRNSPIWTRGVVSRHQSRGEEAVVTM